MDGVLRNLIEKMIQTHEKFYKSEVDSNDIEDYDLSKHFIFEDSEESLEKFLYEDCSLEIFGYSNEIEDGVVTKLNDFLLVNKGEHEIVIISREVGRAIPSTLFFLSKTGCLVENIKFVKSYEEMWENCDMLLTSFPKALEVKPEGKISIRVERKYNKGVISDYSIKNTTEFLEEGYLNKIINTKTVEHKELN